jgi:hypothetical protein
VRVEASPVRHAMLFGTGSALESAVAQVLADAGLHVEPLDEKLGTVSGDLLVEHVGDRILVEVKSSDGVAPERAARRRMPSRKDLPLLLFGLGSAVQGIGPRDVVRYVCARSRPTERL